MPIANRKSEVLSNGRHEFVNAKWLAFRGVTLATIILAIIVGFFVRGGLHGEYMDDYSVKTWAFDFNSMKWKPTLRLHLPGDPIGFRPLVYLLTPNIANLLPNAELPARIGIVMLHLLNVLLLAALAQRLTKSLFTGVVAGASFLFPVLANEGVLWLTAAIADTFSLLFILIGFHLLLSCRSLSRDLPLLVLGVSTWILGIMFYESGALTLILLPFCFRMVQHERSKTDNKPWLVAIAGAYFPLALYAMLVARNSPTVTLRGGITLNPTFIMHKIPDVTRNLIWLVTKWGVSGPLRDAAKLGWHEWSTASWGLELLASLVLGLCLIVALFPINDNLRTLTFSTNMKLFLIGSAWIAMGLVPILVVRSQIVEIRTLYIPSAGMALSLAALLGLVVDLVGFLSWQQGPCIRVLLLGTAASVLLASLSMAGLVRTYELRWHRDQIQIAASQPLVSFFPKTHPIWLLPINLDENIVSEDWHRKTLLDGYLFGVFEHNYSASDGIRLTFGDRLIRVGTAQHWDGLRIASIKSEAGQAETINIQGEDVPVRQLIAFTYKEGQLLILNPLTIASSTGPSITVELPLATQLARRGISTQAVQLQINDI